MSDSKPTVFWEKWAYQSGETEYKISFDGPNEPHITLAINHEAGWRRLLLALSKVYEMREYVEPPELSLWDEEEDEDGYDPWLYAQMVDNEAADNGRNWCHD